MFDDVTPKNAGAAPANLPLGEPEDIFADEKGAPAPVLATESAPSSALGSGLLKPKMAVTPAPVMAEAMNEAPVRSAPAPTATFRTPPMLPPEAPPMPAQMYDIKEPRTSRGLVMIVVIVVALGALGAGGWWVYRSWLAKAETPAVTPVDTGTGDEVIDPLDEPPAQNNDNRDDNVAEDLVDDEVLFGEPIDSDADGLDDVTERELGTDPANWDTDADELNDYNEVAVWKTDPFRSDTDNDGFIDGQEIKHGYSPTGPGKIFEPPAAEPSAPSPSVN